MPALAVAVLASLLAASPSAAPASWPPRASPDPSPPPTSSAPILAWEAVSRRPHDDEAWTQGLQLDEAGRLYESTGLLGHSTLREVNPRSGEVLRSTALPDNHFGEGLALVGDRLIQLTWKQGTASVWDRESFDLLDTYAYTGQGWGLCFDGERLVMSDGSDRLTFRDPASFDVLGEVAVTLDGQSLSSLNELECVDGVVWANVWNSDHIVRIDPSTGLVTGRLDLSLLAEGQERLGGSELNGIAYDALAGTYLVTGKLWPELFEIRVLETGQR